MKKCKCKNSKSRIIGKVVICNECNNVIIKIRTTFYKKTQVKPNKKKYNRPKVKEDLRKELK